VAGRATYTEADKAKVYVVLTANDGNVKRTSRETGVPENTVRRWRNEFRENPPAIEAVTEAAGDFIEDADRVRHKALLLIEKKVDAGDAKLNELNNTVGILTDKIDRARGLGDSRRVEHSHQISAPDELRALMGDFVAGMKELATNREAEIMDAEIVEQPALPSGS